MLFSGLMLLIVLFWNRARPLAVLLSGILVLLALYLHALIEMYGELGSDSFKEASDFDFHEATFYLKTLASHVFIYPEWDVLGWSLGATLLVLAMAWAIGAISARRRYRDGLILVAAIALAASGTSAGIRSAMAQFHEAATIFATAERNLAFPGKVGVSKATAAPLAVMLYVGESTSALNMQLYGYPRRTTPALVALAAADPGVLVFDKVFSTHTHTSQSLIEAFSMRPSEQSIEVPLDSQRRVSLIDALVSWGVRVALYSNQGRTGAFNFTGSIVFRAADRHFAVDTPIGDIELDARPLDGDYLQTALADGAFSDGSTNMVVFHSYAGHGDYLDYIPAGLPQPAWLTSSPPDYDKRSNSIDDYDTAISYVDANVAKAITSVAVREKPIVLVYFSDHGESPSLDDGHDSSRFRVEMARIPFIIYFNEEARRAFPERFAQMKAFAADRNVATLAQLVPTLLALMGYTVDPAAGLDMPPPLGSGWTPYPILVRSTADGISYLRFKETAEGEEALRGKAAFVESRTTCFAPSIARPNEPPAPANTDCVTLETVKP